MWSHSSLDSVKRILDFVKTCRHKPHSNPEYFSLRCYFWGMRLRRSTKGEVRSVDPEVEVEGKSQKKKDRPHKDKVKNQSRIDHANIELAARLREYGENYGLEEDPYLEGLSNAIKEGKNLAVWASNDVMTLMPHPDVESVEGPIYSAMVLLRNVLVFVPVALTWLAVGKATTAFTVYTTKSSAASVVNFLQFWQNGYGVLSKTWTLSHIAADDFYIIAGVIFLTFVTPFMNRSAVRRATSFEQDALRERLTLVIEVESFLFDKRQLTRLSIDSALAQSFERVVEATHNLSVASHRIKIGLNALPQHLEKEEPKNEFESAHPTRERKLEEKIPKSKKLQMDHHEVESVKRVTKSVASVTKRVNTIIESLPRKAHSRKELKKVQLELVETHVELMGLHARLKKQEQRVEKHSEWKDAKREAERKKALGRPKSSSEAAIRYMEVK